MSSSTQLSSITFEFSNLQNADILTFSANSGTTTASLCGGCCGLQYSQNQISGGLQCASIPNGDGGQVRILVTSSIPFDQINLSIQTPGNNGWVKVFRINNF